MKKEDNKKHSKHAVIFSIVALFLVFAFLLNTFTSKSSVTGNAIMESGNLNPGVAVIALIFISLYAVITCTYLNKKYHA